MVCAQNVSFFASLFLMAQIVCCCCDSWWCYATEDCQN